MASCLAAGIYMMRADILTQVTIRNEETGETERSWEPGQKNVPCYAIPYLEGGARMTGMSETFAERYANNDYLRIKTANKLDKRNRVTNIRNKKNQVLYYGSDGKPTVYNVDGSAPIVNPLTEEPSEWMTTLSRAEIQG